jgi:hypothetical protein
VSAELIAAINEMLATDIFNKAVVNWWFGMMKMLTDE